MNTCTKTTTNPLVTNQWTPVLHELPDDEISLLVCNGAQEDYAVAFHTGDPFDAWRYADTGLILSWTVTHWMHLPDLPTL